MPPINIPGTIPALMGLYVMKTSPPYTRFRALDSLRGLAALIVVFAHIFQAIPAPFHQAHPYLNPPLATLAAAGQFAVIVFFVLSGFVLSLPYWNAKNQPYALYMTRRFCRLYLPYAFAVLVAAFLCAALTDPASRLGWPMPVSSHIVKEHLLMTGVGSESTMLDGPLWSLIIEMRVSLIFPLLFLAVRRFEWAAIALGLIGSFVCCKLNALHGAQGEAGGHFGIDALGALLLTARYIPAFLFGIFAAGRLDTLRRLLASLPLALHAAICAGIVALHTFLFTSDLQYHGYGDILYGIMAIYLIISCTTFAALVRRLSGDLFLWLGDISYSLYLIHVPVLYAVINILQKDVGYGLAITVAVPAILVSAHLMYHLIERPSIWLGRKCATGLNWKRAPQVIFDTGTDAP
jgi:peptidoglycan/LPS O-acetylase OafA/YrhL